MTTKGVIEGELDISGLAEDISPSRNEALKKAERKKEKPNTPELEGVIDLVEFLEEKQEVKIDKLKDLGLEDPLSLYKKAKAKKQAHLRGFQIRKSGEKLYIDLLEKETPEKSFEGATDKDYFSYPDKTPTIKKLLKKGDNVLLVGPPGSGKSELADRLLNQIHDEGPIFIELSQDIVGDDLFGNVALKDGETVVEYGPVVEAMKQGRPLIIEEVDAGPPGILFRLHNPLINRPVNLTKQGTEEIYPKEGFHVVATANTIGRGDDEGLYTGTGVLNEAFLDRYDGVFEIEYPSKEDEEKIIRNRTGLHNEELLEKIVKFASKARRAFENNEMTSTLSVRKTITMGEYLYEGMDEKKVFNFTILNKVKEHDRIKLEEIFNRVF